MNSAVNRYSLRCRTSSLRCRAEEKPINLMSDEPDIDTLGIKALKELYTSDLTGTAHSPLGRLIWHS